MSSLISAKSTERHIKMLSAAAVISALIVNKIKKSILNTQCCKILIQVNFLYDFMQKEKRKEERKKERKKQQM